MTVDLQSFTTAGMAGLILGDWQYFTTADSITEQRTTAGDKIITTESANRCVYLSSNSFMADMPADGCNNSCTVCTTAATGSHATAGGRVSRAVEGRQGYHCDSLHFI